MNIQLLAAYSITRDADKTFLVHQRAAFAAAAHHSANE